MVKLKSLKTMKYVAISSTGQIYSTVRLFLLKMFVKKVNVAHLDISNNIHIVCLKIK